LITPVKNGRKTIRVVIAEDQGMVLGALAALLEIEGDITVISKARNGKEALALVLKQKPDVLITDIEMPDLTGLGCSGRVKATESRNESHHLDYFRTYRISAKGIRRWRIRLHAERHAGRAAGGSSSQSESRAQSHRSATGNRGMG